MADSLSLRLLPGRFAVCRLPPRAEIPAWADGSFVSITRTGDELSLVCPEGAVPAGTRCESGWRVLQVKGPLDFALTGILASIAQPLAAARVSIYAISTFDTDHVLVREHSLEEAVAALRQAGHRVES
jgi:uncharacterized protein